VKIANGSNRQFFTKGQKFQIGMKWKSYDVIFVNDFGTFVVYPWNFFMNISIKAWKFHEM